MEPLNDIDNEDLIILSQVKLKSFSADPQNILPFGASRIKWEIEGPVGGFKIYLNEQAVSLKGNKIVQPDFTTVYKLKAKAGTSHKDLASVKINVNVDSCQQVEWAEVRRIVISLLDNVVENDPTLYFRLKPTSFGSPEYYSPILNVSSGRIRFMLYLNVVRDSNWFLNWLGDDPALDINASFGLRVDDGILVPSKVDIKTEIRPYWLLKPWASSNEIEAGEQKASDAARQIIEGIVDIFNFHLVTHTDGMTMHSVKIKAEDEEGVLTIMYCPDDPIQAVIDFSTTNKKGKGSKNR